MTLPETNHQPRVLVVDDNEDLCEIMCLRLEGSGLSVKVAHDGRGALEAARAENPDIVFVDFSLPDMTGAEVAQEMRAALKSTPSFVGLTGYEPAEVRAEMSRAGVNRIVRKPLSSEDLKKILADIATESPSLA